MKRGLKWKDETTYYSSSEPRAEPRVLTLTLPHSVTIIVHRLVRAHATTWFCTVVDKNRQALIKDQELEATDLEKAKEQAKRFACTALMSLSDELRAAAFAAH